jgi:hypothetical protein
VAVAIRPTLYLVLLGTSLTTGRLCTPPGSWPTRLIEDMRADASCKGPVAILNIGQGSTTSDFGRTQSVAYAQTKPTHVLYEDFGINDCAIGPVSLPQAAINNQAIIDNFRGANPDVVMVHQTMSPASAADVARVNLAAYYTQGTAIATANGIETIDNNATWPKPLDPALTVDMDGLHPIWDAAFALYSYPNIKAWALRAQAAFWPD